MTCFPPVFLFPILGGLKPRNRNVQPWIYTSRVISPPREGIRDRRKQNSQKNKHRRPARETWEGLCQPRRSSREL